MNRRRFLELFAAITAKPKALLAPLPAPAPVEPIVTTIGEYADLPPFGVSYNVKFTANIPPTARLRLRYLAPEQEGPNGGGLNG